MYPPSDSFPCFEWSISRAGQKPQKTLRSVRKIFWKSQNPKQSKPAKDKFPNKLTAKQAENLKLIFQAMIANPNKNTANGIAEKIEATMDNCSQAKVNILLNSALQLFPDLVTSDGKAAGRKVSLIQGVSFNDLIQAVNSKTKSKS